MINTKFTDTAIRQLENITTGLSDYYVVLHYEMGGCGSPLDGVLRLQIVNGVDTEMEKVKSNWIPLYINKHFIPFLDNEINIHYANGFQIKSANQTYSYSHPIEVKVNN